MSLREDFSEHQMPSDASCFYRDADHSYWRGIEPKKRGVPEGDWKGVGRLTGVSTAASPFDFRPDNLMRWAAKTNGIGVAELVQTAYNMCEVDPTLNLRDELAWLLDPDTIWQALERDSLTFNDVRDQAAERGTNVHKYSLYELATGRQVSDHEKLTDEERGYAHGIESFWLEHLPEPLSAEQVVMDLELGVAGRLDLRARLGARCGRVGCPCADLSLGAVFLGDAKTSGFLPIKHHVQIAGYEHCAQVSGVGSSEAQWIIQVDEGGGWELVPVRATLDDFRAAVDLYGRTARISRAARADQKACAAA